MSDRAQLPVRANLEHLRNEARQRLKTLRLTDPETKLTAAQLDVARAYGFASWRKLKAYIDALHSDGARLVAAVRSGDLAAIRSILDAHPDLADAAADLEEHQLRPSDALAMRLVHLAVAENQPGALKLLIERGANLNLRNGDHRLALHDCFELGRDELARMLIDAGAEVDVCAAAAYGLNDRLRVLLAADPGQASGARTGVSPLGWAIYGNQVESARILFEHGARPDRPPDDEHAWQAATHVANVKMARVLLDRGADPNCRIDNGDTPLHAVLKSRIVLDPGPFVELLLNAGADRTLRNGDGLTAYEVALAQTGRIAETYFPARPLGAKKLDAVLAMLK